VSLSIIVPTVGRWTLERTLDSIRPQLHPEDELIVVYSHEVTQDPSLGRGGAEKVEGTRRATGTHLAFMDDDDVYLPGALDLMRAHAADVPVIFRLDGSSVGIGTIWREPELRYTNVSTQMFVVPNDPTRLGEWAPHEQSGARGLPAGQDFTFLTGCVERMGAPVWRPEVIAQLRPPLSVTVVTPWFNHPELLDGYQDALRAAGPCEVVVVDDGSDPRIPYPDAVTADHRGFCHASNVGLELAETDVVLFLNNDVVATAADWLRPIREAVEPGVLVGARLRSDPHGDVDGQALPYLDGWCLAGMRDDLVALGGFSESLAEPAYYSDNLLCLNARAAGMTLREVRVGLRHLENRTAGHSLEVERVTLANRAVFAARARDLLRVAA
jgi:hypothetical protein